MATTTQTGILYFNVEPVGASYSIDRGLETGESCASRW